jgi:hypothetical protein
VNYTVVVSVLLYCTLWIIGVYIAYSIVLAIGNCTRSLAHPKTFIVLYAAQRCHSLATATVGGTVRTKCCVMLSYKSHSASGCRRSRRRSHTFGSSTAGRRSTCPSRLVTLRIHLSLWAAAVCTHNY